MAPAAPLQTVERCVTREHGLIGASLARVSLGAWAVYFYVLHWPLRRTLWGPDGIFPYEAFLDLGARLNVFAVSRSPVVFEALMAGGLALGVMVALGVAPRITLLLHWVMLWSLQERNPLLADGGDNVMRIALLFLCLMDTAAYGAVHASGTRPGRGDGWERRGRARLASCDRLRRWPATGRALHAWLGRWAATGRAVRAVAHNAGLALIVAQLGLLYLSTGLYKTMGELWQQGTALYYILRVDEFSLPGRAEIVYRSVPLVVLGTYGTVLFELMFLPCLANRWTRYAVLVAGVCFHAAIAYLMGLVTFAWSMLSLYPLLVTDDEYRGLAAWVRRRWGLRVFYDGWCPWCTRSARWLERLDLLGLAQWVSFRAPGVLERYGLDPDRAARRIQSLDSVGRRREGIDALLAVTLRAPLLWPAVPVLAVGRFVAGQRLYDLLASRRLILVPGACGTHCEASPPRRAEG
ncbi:MAG: DCC1-like thiol-disulfide oxidoreductase family protein [Armatimonadota bacterium]|nr:DCC1-like thiol-disulfide oxidoreductase family protein [Armatimonadota bacterium]MDR7485264.1 DCC1-like thiol-disulfide oxidoreductase family protein [Armatimonadota bacterium]MDR7533898.1 DCC1-like thiol-disulfide oxidoreductase family protein [Armatimonadota bacterium]MDR7537140.1 DCC1-like thiol-disulfide oxidoreductase family protein [Armatimonadota bacterium]